MRALHERYRHAFVTTSLKLIQLAVVTGLTVVWVLILIDQPYPPSRWNLLFALGMPFTVATVFALIARRNDGRPVRLIGLFLWIALLCGWEFLSVIVALAVHGT